MTMKSLRRALAAFAVPALLVTVLAGSASAAPYYYNGAETGAGAASAFTQFYAATSYNLISIQSGHVNCPAYNGAHVTWCGTVGNNTSHAQAGVNFTVNGVSYWMRDDMYAPVASGTGQVTCSTRGNAPSHFITACNGVAT